MLAQTKSSHRNFFLNLQNENRKLSRKILDLSCFEADAEFV